MGIRFVFNPYDSLLNAISQDRQQLSNATLQVSTGRKLISIADNPAATASVIENNFETAAIDQFTQSASSVQTRLQASDSALNSTTEALTSAISLATEGANGTLSQDQRNAIAQQIDSLQQEVLGLANSQFQGTYLFGGTATTTAPYVADSSAPSGVKYVGNGETSKVEIDAGQYVQNGLPGSAIFNGAGADVFQALHDLSAFLRSGDSAGIASANTELESAFSNVTVQRISYGGMLQQLEAAGITLSNEQTSLASEQNSLLAADPAKAITDMTQAQTQLEAALAAAGRVTQNSLLNYLK